MKRLALAITLLIVSSALLMSFAGCTTLSVDEGIEYLQETYKNTLDNYGKIYQYSERIYDKAVENKPGRIINRTVNINCAVDKHYNLLMDKDYTISVYESKKVETIDKTAKLTSKEVASQNLIVGDAKIEGKDDKTKAVFVSTNALDDNGKWVRNKYVQKDVDAKAFASSTFFKDYALFETQVFKEVGMLTKDNMIFDIDKGGIVRKGKTVDYNFKVTDAYLKDYREKYGRESIFVGKRVWVQTAYDRIANIYVYREEKLAGQSLDYEAYTFMITYLGPKIGVPAYPSQDNAKPEYTPKDIFDGQQFEDGIYAKIK